MIVALLSSVSLRRAFAFWATIYALCIVPRLHAESAAGRPNILLIQADDLGFQDLGCYGAAHYRTPAIDRLAQDAIRFTQAYAASSICTPSRAGLLTGLHPARLHVTGQPGYQSEDTTRRKFAHPDFKTSFPTKTPSIGRSLAASGYHTVCLEKWGFSDKPGAHGFVEASTGDDAEMTARALGIFATTSSRPFFINLNYRRPHIPLRPSPSRKADYARLPAFTKGRLNPAYAAEIEELDLEVGRLLDGLAQHDLVKQTVVILTSDNGGFMGDDKELIASNAPLREGKASLYEGGLRVPAIVRWPGVIAPRSVCDTPIHGVQWHATLNEIAGTSKNVQAPLDGRSFAALFRGETFTPQSLYWHYPHYRRAMASIKASPSSAVRVGDWKLLHFYEDDHVELYNLRDDPGESRDLAAKEKTQAAALRAQLDSWRAAADAQKPAPHAL